MDSQSPPYTLERIYLHETLKTQNNSYLFVDRNPRSRVLGDVHSALAQLNDRTQNPNVAGFGIAKSLTEQIGNGTGDWTTPDSSSFIIARDPFRAIRRGRQLFQRKFLRSQGQGPMANDGIGDINTNLSLGAGVSDSCAGCHGRPRGAAGVGRRCGDETRQPRCATPVWHWSEGNAG